MPIGPNRVLALLVAAVAVLAIVAGVVVAGRDAPALDPGSPEAAVQGYLEAVLDGDYRAAADLVAPSTGCDAADVAQAFVAESAQIVLTDTTVDGDRAVVTLDVTEGAGDGPFGGEGFTRSERVTLERVGGTWKLAGSSWLLYLCDAPKEG